MARLRADALAAWRAGLDAVAPEACVARSLAARPDLVAAASRTLVVAVGKAAAGMARGAIAALAAPGAAAAGQGPRIIVLMPAGDDAGELPPPVLVLRGGHPHPTAEGIEATRRIVAEVAALGRGDRLLFLVSGGASALFDAPAGGLDAGDLIAAHRALVASGLAIASINLVRGCLSAVKAGRLAELTYPASVSTLAISDVEGDEPATIGSGPTVAPRISRANACREALDLVRSATVTLPAAAIAVLEAGASQTDAAAPPREADGDFVVVASIANAVAAARRELVARGYRVAAPGDYLRGSTADAATRILRSFSPDFAAPGEAVGAGPVAAVFGGETTVALPPRGTGRGGRNLDLAARVALAIDGRGAAAPAATRRALAAIAAGTDGRDGSSRAAGAVVDGGTASRAEGTGRPLGAALASFDTEPALDAAGDLVVTGPTGTNVGDLVVTVAAGL